MKKSSLVWKFFDRIEENQKCIAVLCKLCDSQYKFFGNTTNLRIHLTNRHPIQWDLCQNESLGDVADKSNVSPTKRRRYAKTQEKNVRYSLSLDRQETDNMPKIEIQRVDVFNTDTEDQDENDKATINLVRQLHSEQNSDEDWTVEDPFTITRSHKPKQSHLRMKYRQKAKREVSSPVNLPNYYIAPSTETKVLYENHKQSDEYSVFGEYVANKLRKVKSPRTRGNLQQLITTLLWQSEYGMYDNAETVKRLLMYSIQSSECEPIEIEETQVTMTTEEMTDHTQQNHSVNVDD